MEPSQGHRTSVQLVALDVADVAAMLQLVSAVCDPASATSTQERRERLYEGLAGLADADMWMGGIAYSSAENPSDPALLRTFDGGWRNIAERMSAWGIAQNMELGGDVNRSLARALDDLRPLTFLRAETMDDEAFHTSPGGRAWRNLGFDHFVMSIFPLPNQMHSAIGLHRRLGRSPFTARERTIVHIVWQQVEWLHRRDGVLPIGKQVLELTLRERQVLLLLQSGATIKSAAEILRLSPHTIGDHVKAIYRKLNVRRRTELVARFLT